MADEFDQYKTNTKSSATPAPQGDDEFSKYRTQTAQASQPSKSIWETIKGELPDVGKGLGETLAQNVASANSLIHKVPVLGNVLAPQAGVDYYSKLAHPENDAQQLGKTIGNVGESVAASFIPGADVALPVRAALQGALQAGTTGLQGGSKSDVELAGAGGQLGELGGALLGKVVAPKIAQAALHVKPEDIAYGANPGKFIIDNTKSWGMDNLTNEAKGLVNAAKADTARLAVGKTVDLNPAAQEAFNQAGGFSSHGADKSKAIYNDLFDPFSGHSDWGKVPVEDALQARTDVGALGRYNPLASRSESAVSKASKPVYKNISDAIKGVDPQIAANDSLVQSAIPVLQRGKQAALKDSVKSLIPSSTVGGVLGGIEGAHDGGPTGALKGALIGGIVGPASQRLITSPSTGLVTSRLAALAGKYGPEAAAALLGLLPKDEDH